MTVKIVSEIWAPKGDFDLMLSFAYNAALAADKSGACFAFFCKTSDAFGSRLQRLVTSHFKPFLIALISASATFTHGAVGISDFEYINFTYFNTSSGARKELVLKSLTA